MKKKKTNKRFNRTLLSNQTKQDSANFRGKLVFRRMCARPPYVGDLGNRWMNWKGRYWSDRTHLRQSRAQDFGSTQLAAAKCFLVFMLFVALKKRCPRKFVFCLVLSVYKAFCLTFCVFDFFLLPFFLLLLLLFFLNIFLKTPTANSVSDQFLHFTYYKWWWKHFRLAPQE